MLQNAFNLDETVTQTIVIMAVVFQFRFWPYSIISGIANTMRDVTNLYNIKIILWLYLVSNSLVFATNIEFFNF